MKYQIKNIPFLKKVLWADSIAGGVTAVAGLLLYPVLVDFLGLPANLIVIIAAVTLAYALLALRLALQSKPSTLLLKVLVYANWVWTLISVGLLIWYIFDATVFGVTFLVLQVVVVGMLAWLEGRHIHSANDAMQSSGANGEARQGVRPLP
jgi:hypothetical protein